MVTTRPGQSFASAEAEVARAALLRRDTALLRELLRAGNDLLAVLEERILVVSQLIARRAAEGVPQTAGSVVRLAQSRALLAEGERQLQILASTSETLITGAQRANIEAAVGDALRLVDGQLPGGLRVADLRALGIEWAVVDADALVTFVGTLRDGSTLSNYLERHVVDGTMDDVRRILRSGLSDNPRVTARRLRGAFAGGQVQAMRVARTETLRAYREAERAQYAANPRLVQGYRRMEALDDRTCVACWMLDGTLYRTSSEMDEHVQGRGFLVPELVPPRDLGIPLDPEPRPPAGREVFKRLPAERQRKIIGNQKMFDAWKSGEISDAGLVRHTVDPIWGASTSANSAVRALRGDHIRALPDIDEFYDPASP